MPKWKITFSTSNLNSDKYINYNNNILIVHKDFGCVNHNSNFDKE